MNPQKNKNLFLFFLIMLGITAAIVGGYQIYGSVYVPLKIPGKIKSVSDQRKEIEKSSLEYMLSLQKFDTDKDGLSDYDEAYSYGTSVYLADTDSDGVDDKTELTNGDDPRCHKDKICDSDLQEQTSDIPKDAKIPIPETSEPYISPQFSDTSGEFTVEELRAMLQQSGFSEEQMNAFSDEELMQTWQEVLQGGGASAEQGN